MEGDKLPGEIVVTFSDVVQCSYSESCSQESLWARDGGWWRGICRTTQFCGNNTLNEIQFVSLKYCALIIVVYIDRFIYKSN